MKWFVSKAKTQNTQLCLQQYEEEGHGLNLELANEHLLSNKMKCQQKNNVLTLNDYDVKLLHPQI
jgi:hypothetical protein